MYLVPTYQFVSTSSFGVISLNYVQRQ